MVPDSFQFMNEWFQQAYMMCGSLYLTSSNVHLTDVAIITSVKELLHQRFSVILL